MRHVSLLACLGIAACGAPAHRDDLGSAPPDLATADDLSTATSDLAPGADDLSSVTNDLSAVTNDLSVVITDLSAVTNDLSGETNDLAALLDLATAIDLATAADLAVADTPAVTAPGTPLRLPPTMKTIDAAGGTIVADNGRLTITIPAGALAAATTIGVQAISNTAPGGVGAAYRLTPDGQTFAQPIALTLKPTAADLNDTALAVLGAAYQDPQGRWPTLPVTVDAQAGTVRTTTTHFADYGWVANVYLAGSIDATFTNQITTYTIYYSDETAPFVPSAAHPIDSNTPVTWAINGTGLGDATVGSLLPLGIVASYQAPAQLPDNNVVAVSASLLHDGARVILVANMHILAHAYRLQLALTDVSNCLMVSGASHIVGYTLTTQATYDITLDGSFGAASGSGSPSSAPGISGFVPCQPMFASVALGPGATDGLAITQLAGGWSKSENKLHFFPSGSFADVPDYTLTPKPVGNPVHHAEVVEDLANSSPFFYFDGRKNEDHDYPNSYTQGSFDEHFTLTVLTP
jgi:hypothetical protein